MNLYTAAQMRAFDQNAINKLGIPSTVLMERAARALADAAESIAKNKSAAIFCSGGNNGGDGVEAACQLVLRGFTVMVLMVGDPAYRSPDFIEMERRFYGIGGSITIFEPNDNQLKYLLSGYGVVIDAMLGTGLNTPLTGKFLDAVRLINSLPVPVVAADIPSGVSADTGEILGDAVRCNLTVTFAGPKCGLFLEPGCVYRGELRICDIGIPTDEQICGNTTCFAVTRNDVLIPHRQRISHKGDYGKILIIAGSVGYTGAPALCARSSVRSGAGLVSLGVPEAIYPAMAVKMDEAMPFPLPCDNAGRLNEAALSEILERLKNSTLCLLGPGLGRGGDLNYIVAEIIKHSPVPIVLDADGINAINGNIDILDEATQPVILTPHEGEFSRLGGNISEGRMKATLEFSERHRCITVLKGHRTITAFPDGECYINTTGNPGMAKGGSGDVLSGIIAALTCRIPLKNAVPYASFIHGLAGDICAERFGEDAMTPSDMIGTLPQAFTAVTAAFIERLH